MPLTKWRRSSGHFCSVSPWASISTSACKPLTTTSWPLLAPKSNESFRYYKCWKVTGILPWSALLFVVGYILREIGAFNYGNIEVFISSLVFIYAAPYVLSSHPTPIQPNKHLI